MTSLTFESGRWYNDGVGTHFDVVVNEPKTAIRFFNEMKQKKYVAEIKEHRNKRSLDANAYFWVLAGKLAANIGVTPNEIYKQYIPDIADNYEIVPVRSDMIDRWNTLWVNGHLGRMTDDLGECRNIKGYHNIRCYFGSSDYDTAQMSRLIDLIVDDCKAAGIETMTPDELSNLKSLWGAADG